METKSLVFSLGYVVWLSPEWSCILALEDIWKTCAHEAMSPIFLTFELAG
jgi:hypothetical protein